MLKVRLGQPVEIEGEITSTKTGELVDPDDPAVRLLLPNGETTDLDLTKVSTGIWLLSYYDPPEWGTYGLLSTGSGEWKFAAERERLFHVIEPKIPRD